MRGVISALAPDGTYGQIAADDGQRYSYWTSEIRNGPARINDVVNFQMSEGQPIDIFIIPKHEPMASMQPEAAPRPVTLMARAPVHPGQGKPAGHAAAMDYSAAGKPIPTDKNYWITLFTSPSGRISRKQFWLHGVVPLIVVSVVVGWIPVIGQLVSLAVLWASICIAFKRFHDLGYPGWYSLLYLVALVLGGVIFAAGFAVPRFLGMSWLLAEILWGIGALIGLAQLIFVYIRPGQDGPNEYGPDPLATA